MSSRLIDYIIIGLVGMFLCISFINFSFTCMKLLYNSAKNADENPDIALTLFVVSIIEMIILATFLLEIILKSIAFGVKVYFKDYWLVFDAIIIVLSMIMLLLDFVLKDAQFMTVSKVIRGVFRFLRLFLVFRKVQFILSCHSSIKSKRLAILDPGIMCGFPQKKYWKFLTTCFNNTMTLA